MHQAFKSYAIAGLISLLVMLLLCLTPLRVIPQLIAVFMEAGTAAVWWLLAVAFGAPLGGFLWTAIFTPAAKWQRTMSQLAGFWTGIFTGSFFGAKLLGTI